ncbi:uncharacterized protein V1516DRAFT_452911 [Lipomyces oligophaga]|uniref:uncharacterized protein n=1 Tax=Lipomyces oligophaga TaxID=45792 RepID=UPI0034CE18B1
MTSELHEPFLRLTLCKSLAQPDFADHNWSLDLDHLGKTVQIIKFISYESAPPNAFIESIVSDSKHYVYAVFSHQAVDEFERLWHRRLTQKTVGCLITILSAKLHIVRELVEQPGSISRTLNAPPNFTPNDLANFNRLSIAPVLFITEISYIGADGCAIIGRPEPLYGDSFFRKLITLIIEYNFLSSCLLSQLYRPWRHHSFVPPYYHLRLHLLRH